jgi:protein TonB
LTTTSAPGELKRAPDVIPPRPSTTTTNQPEQLAGSERDKPRQPGRDPSTVPAARQSSRVTPIDANKALSPTARRSQTASPVRVGGAIKQPKRLVNVAPVYPAIAQSARVQGVVIVEATIGSDGRVQEAKVLRSIPLLDAAALDAVKQWVYEPTLLNGVPVPVIMTVTINFTLTDTKAEVVKYVSRLEASSDVATAVMILKTVFDVTANDSRSALAVFTSLKLRVNGASESQLDQIEKMIPK